MRVYILFLITLFAGSAAFAQNNVIETVLQKGHSQYVSCLAFSPNGKFIATGSHDNTVKLWDYKSGKEIRSFSQHTGFIRNISFSSDGTRILSASADNRAIVFNIETGDVIVDIKQAKNRLWKACFSPDGSKVLTMDDRTDLKLWDASTGELLKTYKKEYDSEISEAWFTPNGTAVMHVNENKENQITYFSDSSFNRTFKLDKTYSYAISPNGKILAVGTSTQYAKLFNLETGERLDSLVPNPEQGCSGCKTRLMFSHSGKYLATVTKYSGVDIWEVKSGKKVMNFEYSSSWVDAVAFSPNDKYIQVTADDETSVWDIQLGKKVRDFNFNGLECIPVFSPDSKSLLTTAENNIAALWNIATGSKTRTFQGYLNKQRDDGMKFDQGNWYHSNIIRYLNLKTAAVLHPNGKWVARTKVDSVVVLMNIETGKVERVFEGHSKAVLSVDFSEDGEYMLSASGDRTIKMWSVSTGELIRTYRGHGELVFDARFSSDNIFIVSGSWDATLRIWNTETGKLHSYVDIEEASPFRVDFTPYDLYAISSDLGDNLKLYEVDAAKEFRSIIGHTAIVTDIAFSPDSRLMATSSLDGKVKVWDLLSGMLVRKLSGHTSGVFSLAYHPNNNLLISGSNDRTIKVWDLSTGKVIKNLTGHSAGVTSLSVSKDGKRLVSCTKDGETKVWDLENLKELYTYIQIDRSTWLSKTPSGYFDGSPDALKQINYVSGTEVIPVSALFEKYYTPNLIKRLQAGEHFNAEADDIKALIQSAPSIQIGIIEDAADTYLNTDTIVWFKEKMQLALNVTDNGRGVEEIRVFNNGKLIQNNVLTEKSIRAGKKHSITVEVPVGAGENKITAVALNKDRTESLPVSMNVYYDGIESEIDLYILSIGINKYLNPTYELGYAVDDAKAYNKRVKNSASAIFNHVEEVFIKDTDADKAGIEKAFADMAAKAGPEDVFIFYYAGHGAMGMNRETREKTFFIIPYDVTNMYGDYNLLAEKGVSSGELLSYSKQIKAGKQMFILDACQSGGALEAFNSRGADREKAIAQLARSTGTFFLLASGAVQYASEAKELGHGLFTYAILEGLDGSADGGSKDNKITANELKGYVEDRVPELTNEYMLTPQYPTGYGYGQDFPIVIVKE